MGRSAAVSTATTPGRADACLGVDRGDQRVRLVGQDEPGVEQPGHGRVSGELGRAPHLGLGVTTRGGDADRGHSATLAPREARPGLAAFVRLSSD